MSAGELWNYPALCYDLRFTTPQSLSVLMIDTNVASGPENPTAADKQWNWIQWKLAHSRRTGLFHSMQEEKRAVKTDNEEVYGLKAVVAGHYPMWSIGHHGPASCVVHRPRPPLKKYGATVYLSGHDHDLQWWKVVHSSHVLCFHSTNT
ncbi:tartrate-resistant acid phosphatase type 5-like [Pempheris klunzingeri]|uniref:tartrate-resistant acid phosphatase type 5-like n=1 Tax=Pempheris klunzingeri TaxID=3127111 RepID=UPI0039810ADD